MTSVFYLKCTNIHILVIMRTKHFLKVKLKEIKSRLACDNCTCVVLNTVFYILWKHGLAIFFSVRRMFFEQL